MMPKRIAVLAVVLMAGVVCAQRAPSGPDTSGLAELPAIKKRATAGDVQAQLALAGRFIAHSRPADALEWYRRAAGQGSAEATCRIGEMLLFGEGSNSLEQRIIPSPAEGIRWTYLAATNGHPRACRNMSVALQNGLGITTNMVEARAWLQLFAENDPAARKKELDQLTLRMGSQDIEAAQQLADRFKRGEWPRLTVRREPDADGRFKLNGITIGGRYPMAIINRKTLAEGEFVAVPVNGGAVNVKCLKISDDSVLIEVQGESEPRLLCIR